MNAMQMKAFALAATIAGLGAGSALAGGIGEPATEPMVAAPVAAAPAHQGRDWTGFYAGAQLGYADLDSNGAGLDGDGPVVGVHGGYRYDFGQAVIGAELDYDFADIDLGADLGTLDEVGRVKLMAGADLGRALVYGTAGYAQAKATVGGADLSGDGAFGGFGVDYAINDSFTVGSEVLFHSFDDFDDTGVDLDATTVTARVGFRF
jgi:outer membrane immunogenic protein